MNIKDIMAVNLEFAPVPFWSLNEKLQKEELIWQLNEFKKKRFGGVFMHARIGLKTKYLSTEWFNRIKDIVKECKKLNISAYIYDEYKWPSGYAGGLVSGKGKEYKQKFLRMIIVKSSLVKNFKTTKKVIYSYRLANNDVALFYIQLFTQNYNPFPDFEIKNGYIDVLNRKVVKKFIDVTHKQYKKYIGNYFGTVVKGVFTDEPCYRLMEFGRDIPMIPWTEKLPEEFKKRRGYELFSVLHYLFDDSSGDISYKKKVKVRYDFWRTVSELFLENFTIQISEWCEKNKIFLTGHLNTEDSLDEQIMYVGDIMSHYMYMQIPGIDMLEKKIDKHNLTLKQVSSVANQLNKERVLVEIFGASGQDLTLYDQKRIADYGFALGVNFINQHLSLYSMKGNRKRDFPPNIFYQQPWWNYYKIINIYFSRISHILSEGKRIVDLLILHPIESVWANYDPSNTYFTKIYSENFDRLIKLLLDNGIDFDFGNEYIMSKYGTVTKDGKLKIKHMEYSSVLLPSLTTLRRTTYNLLLKFVQMGGNLYFLKSLPTFIDGIESKEEIERLVKNTSIIHLNMNWDLSDEFVEFISKSQNFLKFEGDIKGVRYHLRQLNDKKFFLFITNIYNDNKKIMIKMNKIGSSYNCYLIDCFEGKLYNYGFKNKTLRLDFSNDNSYLFYFTPEKLKYKNQEIYNINSFKLQVKELWDIKNVSYNALVIDKGKFIYKSKIFSNQYMLNVRNFINFPHLFIYNFNSRIKTKAFIVMENPSAYKVVVNGKRVIFNNKWWIDKGFKKGSIELQEGVNSVIITVNKDYLEPIYIIGKFGVYSDNNREFYIDKIANQTKIDDITNYGFPFFAGKISLYQNIIVKQTGWYYIKVKKFFNIGAVKIKINNNEKIVLTENKKVKFYLNKGKSFLQIDMLSTLRNLLGPHHLNKFWFNESMITPIDFDNQLNFNSFYEYVKTGIELE